MTGKEMTEKSCEDKNCPVHGQLKTRGRKFRGKVVSTKMDKSVSVKLTHIRKNLKYERFEKRTSKIKAHLPGCMKVKEGAIVQIEECRPLSKTISFVVTQVT